MMSQSARPASVVIAVQMAVSRAKFSRRCVVKRIVRRPGRICKGGFRQGGAAANRPRAQ